MSSRVFSLSAFVLGLSVSSLSSLAYGQSVLSAPFLFATAGVDYVQSSANVEDTTQAVVGPLSLSFMDAGATAAAVNVNYGTLGYMTDKTSAEMSAGWAAGLWADGFTLTGGTGATTVKVSTPITGVTQNDMEYTVYYSTTPFTLTRLRDAFVAANWAPNASVPGATSLLSYRVDKGHTSGDSLLVGSVDVNFGETFYIAAYLSGDGRKADFHNPLVFGISTEQDVSYTSLSGTRYASAMTAAVPEPSSVLLTFAGLLVTGVAASRRKAAGRSA